MAAGSGGDMCCTAMGSAVEGSGAYSNGDKDGGSALYRNGGTGGGGIVVAAGSGGDMCCTAMGSAAEGSGGDSGGALRRQRAKRAAEGSGGDRGGALMWRPHMTDSTMQRDMSLTNIRGSDGGSGGGRSALCGNRGGGSCGLRSAVPACHSCRDPTSCT